MLIKYLSGLEPLFRRFTVVPKKEKASSRRRYETFGRTLIYADETSRDVNLANQVTFRIGLSRIFLRFLSHIM